MVSRMSTDAAAPRGRWFIRLRLAVATAICILNIAMIVPSLSGGGHKVADTVGILIYVAPLIVIFLGAAYSRIVECLGWIALLFFSIRFFIV
jgi:hypothetical protein